MKIAVLGSGNGAQAVAFEWAQHGHNVYIYDFPQFPENIEAVNRAGGITASGKLSGFCEVKYAGHDISEVVPGADIIFAVGPAYSTKPFGEVCKPYVKPGQIFVVCPGSCAGSIVFKNALGLKLEDDSVIVGETSTLPYAVRINGPAQINVFNKLGGGCLFAALPSGVSDRVRDILNQVFTLDPAVNVLQTSLQNANPVLHPAISLLNAALVERTGGDFYFYEDGVTEAVGKLIKAVDDERIAIGRKIGITILSDPVIGVRQGYMLEENYDTAYSKAPGFMGIKAQPKLDYRFFNEDAGFGLVFFTDLAERVGVETPVMDSILKIISVIMNRDYKAEGARDLTSLGLSQYSIGELIEKL